MIIHNSVCERVRRSGTYRYDFSEHALRTILDQTLTIELVGEGLKLEVRTFEYAEGGAIERLPHLSLPVV